MTSYSNMDTCLPLLTVFIFDFSTLSAAYLYMLKLEDIKALNVEPSSHCVGKCPFCSRDKKVRDFAGHLITLDDFKKLPVTFLKNLEWVDFGGNFGDLSTNKELVDIAAFLKEMNRNIILRGDTNGSSQGEAWWEELGEHYRDGTMIFSLDGLEDSHALHRVNTDFNKIIRNVRAFTGAGGNAEWKFILFKHNEHQLDDAAKLAKTIGCSRFFVISSREYDVLRQKPDTIDFRIKSEIFASYQQSVISEKGVATCKPLKNRSIYLAADGTVHPCCLAHCNYITEHEPSFNFIVELIDRYKTEINFKTRPLEEIVGGKYFTEVLQRSRSNSYCIMKCNKHRKKVKQEVVLVDKSFL